MSIIPGRPRLLPFPPPTRACSWSCLMVFLGLRFQSQSIVVEMATTYNLWGHREGLILKVRNKPECKLGEGKYILELSAEEKICKMQGKPLRLHAACSRLPSTLEATSTHQFICIWTKGNLKHFHYLKRAIRQPKRMFLLTVISLGQPPLASPGHCFAESSPDA